MFSAIFKYINPYAFFISFCIGMLWVYTMTSNPDVIYIMPTPDNENSVIYKDRTDTCFKYKSETVECPSESSKINNYDVQ